MAAAAGWGASAAAAIGVRGVPAASTPGGLRQRRHWSCPLGLMDKPLCRAAKAIMRASLAAAMHKLRVFHSCGCVRRCLSAFAASSLDDRAVAGAAAGAAGSGSCSSAGGGGGVDGGGVVVQAVAGAPSCCGRQRRRRWLCSSWVSARKAVPVPMV